MSFFCVSHKGETTKRDGHIKGTGAREGVGAGGLRASGRSDPQGSRPVVGTSGVPKNSATLGSMTESGRGGAPYSTRGI